MDNNNMPNMQMTEQIPEWKLKLSYFYTEHRLMLKRLGLFLFFFFDLIVIFVFGSTFVNYNTGTLREKNLLTKMAYSLTSHAEVKTAMALEPLIFSEATAIKTMGSRYDLAVKVKNNNDDWAVPSFKYTFTVLGQELGERETFILPGQEKYLIYFGSENGTNVQLKVLHTKWERILDYSLLGYKNSVKVENPIHRAVTSKTISAETQFSVYNDSPFDFWEVGLPVVLEGANDNPVAVNYIEINNLMSHERRDINIFWQQKISAAVSEVVVLPEINLLNDEVIKKQPGEPGSPPGLE